MNRKPIGQYTLALAMLCMGIPLGQAQVDAVTGTDTGIDEDIDRIQVTATRRDNAVDTAPVAVTAISGEDIEASGVHDTQGLQTLAPSLFVSVAGSEAGAGVMRIRGIGTAGISNPGLESAVGVFIDGVYRPRAGAALGDLVDLQQVEVARGPQSTLYGKNTSAGAVMVQTRRPDFEPRADVWASLGNRDYWLVGGSLTGGVSESVALRLSVQTQEKDGFIKNEFNGGAFNDRNRWLVRGQALFTPNEDLSVRLIADYAQKNERCCAPPYTLFGPTAGVVEFLGGTVFDPLRSHTVSIDRDIRHKDEERGFSAHIDWQLNDAIALNAIFSHRDWEAETFGDADYSDIDIAYIPAGNTIESRFRSAEFTLHGEHGRFDWMLGAYYGNEKADVDGALLFGADAGDYFSLLAGGLIPPALYPENAGQTSRRFHQKSDFWSLFTHNVLDLGAGFDLTFGVRYLDESKSGGGEVVASSPSCVAPGLPAALRILCGSPAYTVDYDDSSWIGTAGLSKTFDNHAFVYLNYSRGFKAGGINLDPTASLGEAANLTFDPEEVDAWELGFKYPLFGGRVLTRTAFFHSEFTDFQLNVFDGSSFTVSNEAEATARGVEFEAEYHVTDGLRLTGGITYNDAKFGNNTTTEALRNQQVTNAARWSGLLGAYFQHHLPAWRGSLFGNVVARGQSAVNTGGNLHPNKHQGGYVLVNARLGVRFDNHFEVALWGSNLTDRTYAMVIIDGVAQAGSFNAFVGEPRTFGISLRKAFF